VEPYKEYLEKFDIKTEVRYYSVCNIIIFYRQYSHYNSFTQQAIKHKHINTRHKYLYLDRENVNIVLLKIFMYLINTVITGITSYFI
jgi:hypothetical protein